MADFDLNKIKFRWVGDWVLSTSYTKDDVVRFQGKTYVCLLGHTSSATTIYPDLNLQAPNTRWELMFDGNQWRGDWLSNTQYHLGDIAKYNGYLYQCTTEHISTSIFAQGLVDNITDWTIVAATYNWLNAWTATMDDSSSAPQYYNLGDVVSYNGITYICIEKHIAGLYLELDQDKWSVVTRSDNWRYNWQASTRYSVDDIVKYGAISYRCITAHESSATLGLEQDQSSWEIFLEGIDYKGNWATSIRYKKFDIVKSSGSLWKATQGHTSTVSLRADQVNWAIYVPGLSYQERWDTIVEYAIGDIVIYGGYTYTALTNNNNSIPSVNGILQDTGDWELLVAGYRHLGDWINSTEYNTGDVIRDSGYLYIAVADSSAIKPDSNTAIWQVLVTGKKWKNNWQDNTEYSLGDIVTYAGVAYTCILRHQGTESNSRPDLDIVNTSENYWIVLIQGTASNVLTTVGDLRTHNGTDTERFEINIPGNLLKSVDGQLSWENLDEVPNTYYVSTTGTDTVGYGSTLASPFRTVKYACEFVLNNVDVDTTNTVIFIKTGSYDEILPIKIPRNCAIVGDELRSTVILPADSYEQSNMFFVNNGSGIRNMTLQGLSGVLGTPNQYFTSRPSAGAYVSLDPGTGPNDTSVWIINKSCYVQNVSTFGTGCVGMKVDGLLHNGGNRSIVANDFTQVLSDGIGYWASDLGRSELVSVFTYFCHIGYLSENGGILRATNGNNSYGTYGSVAEGTNSSETAITAEIDNRTLEAQVDIVHTDGSKIIAVGYKHAGQEYSSATASILGSGVDANAIYEEFRNGAISEIRTIDPADSTTPGGLNYQFLLNSAQTGSATSITLSAADGTGTSAKYVGMRIFINSGPGIGQYGYIASYNESTKIASVSRDSDDAAGWDHIYPGYPIEAVLDDTTRYNIEPLVSIAEPIFDSTVINTGTTANTYKFIVSDKDQKILVVPTALSETHAYSNDAGSTWLNITTAIETDGSIATGVIYSGQEFIITGGLSYYTSVGGALDNFNKSSAAANNYTGIASDGNGSVILVLDDGSVSYSTNHGSSYSPATGIAGIPSYGTGQFIIIGDNGDVAYSIDNGANWVTTTSALTASTWNSVAYGDGKFVVIGSANKVAYSHDAITWYESNIDNVDTFDTVSYGAGVFAATGNSSNLAKSQDGKSWKTYNTDSTSYALDNIRLWGGMVYMPLIQNWIVVANGSTWNTILLGASGFARAVVSSSRIQYFVIYDSGSNYLTAPVVTVFDPEATDFVDYNVRLADGVLCQPVIKNRGTGYVTATMNVTGNGFADIYQVGKTLNLKNVSLVPGPGANVIINGIDDVTYRLTKIISQTGTSPNFNLVVSISPVITNQNSPNHLESILIKEEYSQVRLTGHDFLDIGTGNINSTRYPELYLVGEDALNPRRPFNETVENGGGRVFYTSSDQDGNYRVGDLFAVEQSTGTVTINADLFDLDGLSELSLGGIQVGGSAVVVREFSKDGSFIANSNNIIPTQAAILKYLGSRISGGGADALTNTLTAGQVKITSTTITTTSNLQINIPVSTNMLGGIDGDYLAQQFFLAKN
jgi:hypothetical protein